MPERRVTEIVRKARGIDHVCVASERGAELSADLGNLQ